MHNPLYCNPCMKAKTTTQAAMASTARSHRSFMAEPLGRQFFIGIDAASLTGIICKASGMPSPLFNRHSRSQVPYNPGLAEIVLASGGIREEIKVTCV